MAPSIGDSALYVKQDDHGMEGITGTYVDESLNAGTERFKKHTEIKLQTFKSKRRVYENFDFLALRFARLLLEILWLGSLTTFVISILCLQMLLLNNFDAIGLFFHGLATQRQKSSTSFQSDI